jgi:hypothetical protein
MAVRPDLPLIVEFGHATADSWFASNNC